MARWTVARMPRGLKKAYENTARYAPRRLASAERKRKLESARASRMATTAVRTV